MPPFHTCEMCGDVFTTDTCLREHLNICRKELNELSECKYEYSHMTSCKIKTKSERKEEALECESCGTYCYNATSLTEHKFTHFDEKTHKCDVYGEEFFNSSTPLYHNQIHTGNKPCQCEVCGICFTSTEALAGHKHTHDQQKKCECDNHQNVFPTTSEDPPNVIIKEEVDLGYQTLTNESPKIQDLELHSPKEEPSDRRELPSETTYELNVTTQKEEKVEEMVIELEPPKELEEENASICHFTQPNEASRITNCKSGKTFNVIPRLQSIVKSPRIKLQTFTCDVCSAEFISKYSLTNHVFRHIDGVPPPFHMCEKCGHVFTTDMCLREHVNICQKKQKEVLEISQLTMCKNKSSSKRKMEKRECEVCGICFYNPATLTLHQVNHIGAKPFKCDICGKEFCWSSTLVHHKISHTQNKPCKCEICGECFISTRSLANHKKIHKAEKEYKCTICGKCFLKNSNLTRHSRAHDVQI